MSPRYIGPDELPAQHAVTPRPAMPIRWWTQLPQVFVLALSISVGTPALGADIDGALPSSPTAAQPDEAADEEDDDPSADYPDDGSGELDRAYKFPVPEGLLPVSPSEEEDLLGNWGDSPAEAED